MKIIFPFKNADRICLRYISVTKKIAILENKVNILF